MGNGMDGNVFSNPRNEKLACPSFWLSGVNAACSCMTRHRGGSGMAFLAGGSEVVISGKTV